MGDEHDDDPIIARRRKARQAAQLRIWLILGVLAAVLIVLPAVGIGVSLIARVAAGPPSGAKTDWNHADLLEYLNKRGMKLEMKVGGGGRVYFVDVSQDRHNADSPSFALDEVAWPLGADDLIVVTMHNDQKEAYDAVGTMGDNGYQWGRFTFLVRSKGRPLLAKIKAALD